MIRNPILKVLSTLHSHQVKFLLIGGQACILYGGAEFSRDTDIAILADEENLLKLKNALIELKAEVIAVPQLDLSYLKRGHAVHFRCHASDAEDIRLDVMSKLRGVAPFETLWERRTTVELADGMQLNLLSLPDLIAAKKTHRDKDWPQIRRLVEADYASSPENPHENQIRLWYKEARSPEILLDLSRRYPDLCKEIATQRPLLNLLPDANEEELLSALQDEEKAERERDRQYWIPLRKELESFRHDDKCA